MTKVLEIECDLYLTAEGEAQLERYEAEGLSELAAARQLAQDELGHTGVDIQLAQVVQR